MPFRLRPGLTYVACQDDIILLDLTHDRFFALPRALRQDFLQLVEEGDAEPPVHAGLMSLLTPENILEVDCQQSTQSRSQPALVGTLPMSEAAPGFPLSLLAFALRALAHVWLQRASLERVTRRLGLRKNRLSTEIVELNKAQRVASAFARITPFFPIKDHCLPVSIGLMWMMLLFRVPASMIIGVRTAPFSAHCWVTVDDLLVNDDLETVRSFTPILAI